MVKTIVTGPSASGYCHALFNHQSYAYFYPHHGALPHMKYVPMTSNVYGTPYWKSPITFGSY
ncbi:hypothetical protein [Falsibacillus albus]|uniref:hypothetical protein n=1 Tax=Falsibacillus albus TaxID=2478915 RepID=UPI0011E59F69|nr:hypothetical protein [Falsibacillus albus]